MWCLANRGSGVRIMSRVVAGAVLGALVAVATPAAADASPVLRVAKNGSARVVKDRFLPSRRTTALPAVPSGTRIVNRSRARARASQALSWSARQRYTAALAEAAARP